MKISIPAKIANKLLAISTMGRYRGILLERGQMGATDGHLICALDWPALRSYEGLPLQVPVPRRLKPSLGEVLMVDLYTLQVTLMSLQDGESPRELVYAAATPNPGHRIAPFAKASGRLLFRTNRRKLREAVQAAPGDFITLRGTVATGLTVGGTESNQAPILLEQGPYGGRGDSPLPTWEVTVRRGLLLDFVKAHSADTLRVCLSEKVDGYAVPTLYTRNDHNDVTCVMIHNYKYE